MRSKYPTITGVWEYTGGGDSRGNGVITLSGTGVNAQVKYMLKFQTRSGGTADIK